MRLHFRTKPINYISYFLKRIAVKYLVSTGKKRGIHLAIFSNDTIGSNITIFGKYEENQLKAIDLFMEANCPEAFNGVALDIGANIGNHSLHFSERFSHVMAYEPNPITYKLLEANTMTVNNIETFNIALSDKSGTAMMTYSNENMGGATLLAQGTSPNTKTITARVSTLDKTITDTSNISMIKIDVEGLENNVLLGGKEFFASGARPVILFEQNKDQIDRRTSPTIETLRAMNYVFYTLEEKHLSSPSIASRIWHSLPFNLRIDAYNFKYTDKFTPSNYSLIIALPRT